VVQYAPHFAHHRGLLILSHYLRVCFHCYEAIPFLPGKAKVTTWEHRILTRFFIFASILSVALLIAIGALSLTHTLSCRWDQGYGTIALVFVEIILMVVAYVYSSKLVKMTEQSTFHIDGNPTITEHLIQEQDQQIQLKIIQMNLVRFAFVFSLVLHLMEISVFYIGK
jgi:hypothetical protein